MNKRSTKFYRKNEEEVMKRLGFKPTKNSGAGWIEKCDGQNEQFICELKSTDKDSFSLKQQILSTLEYHACIAHKTPVFALQFLNKDEIWLAIPEEEFKAYMEFKSKEKTQETEFNLEEDIDKGEQKEYNTNVGDKENINNSYYARLSYKKQKQKEFEKETEKRKSKMKERRNNKDWRKK